MGKGHGDNHRARLKRGQAAFDKKKKRRTYKKIKCNLCGTETRPKKLAAGLCPICFGE